MPDWLSIHEPLLINTIGHCAGAVVFGILFYLLLVNQRRSAEEHSSLPAIASGLAFLWNVGSLLGLATGPAGIGADLVVAASFSVLSLLPAVLLHIALESKHQALWISGYILSCISVGLHIGDVITRAPRLHLAALLIVMLGFAGLTALTVILEIAQNHRAAGSRLAGAMVLFLFAISFVHFSSAHANNIWAEEIALHHAGLPLALFVLLQNYRFLLLDVFLRFVVNASLSAGAILLTIAAVRSRLVSDHVHHAFEAGVFFVCACLLLTTFVYLRNRAQNFLTRAVFLRSNIDDVLTEIRQAARSTNDDVDYIRRAAQVIAKFLRAGRFTLATDNPLGSGEITLPTAVMDRTNWKVYSWVHAIVPLRFSRGDTQYLLLGAREGGRRYLSEDFSAMARVAAGTVEQVEQLRGTKMRHFVSQAELRALQAQINPHFLFNSLNTLYGTIDRENSEARRLVLNLADVFRYLLQSEHTFVEIDQELRIVRAYLEIEQLRLGPRLKAEVEMDDGTLQARIPVLSVQPLVENAVKHGVAPRIGTGFVRLHIGKQDEFLTVTIANSGECDLNRLTSSSAGIGLNNVRRRLELCYGADARFDIGVAEGVTTVGFAIPLNVGLQIATL